MLRIITYRRCLQTHCFGANSVSWGFPILVELLGFVAAATDTTDTNLATVARILSSFEGFDSLIGPLGANQISFLGFNFPTKGLRYESGLAHFPTVRLCWGFGMDLFMEVQVLLDSLLKKPFLLWMICRSR